MYRREIAGGKVYVDPIVGPKDHKIHVPLDVSALDTDLVDERGFLKRGVPIGTGGTPATGANPLQSAAIAGGAAGDHTVAGIAPEDQLVSVLHLSGDGTNLQGADELVDEFTITAADTINNAGGTATTNGRLVILYRSRADADAGRAVIVLETTKVAEGNTAPDLAAASDRTVACLAIGIAKRAFIEENLGRALTAAELMAIENQRTIHLI